MKKVALVVLALSAVAFAGGDIAPAEGCSTCDGSALGVIAGLAMSAISVALVAFKK
jgi:hypothetical protein